MSAVIPSNRRPALQGGLTLAELMVAMMLGIFLVGSLLTVFQAGRLAYLDTEQLSRIQESVRFANDYMVRDIRSAGFRDETFLRVGHEQQIREKYAQLLDADGNAVSSGTGSVLRIRYAGRGHCTQAFDEFRVVENEYSVIGDELVCRGRTVPRDDAGSVLLEDQDWSSPVGLVKGITGISFQRICPGGGTACTCNLLDNIEESCIGVRLALLFEGLKQFGSANLESQSIQLIAAFRNVILDRMNAAVATEES